MVLNVFDHKSKLSFIYFLKIQTQKTVSIFLLFELKGFLLGHTSSKTLPRNC